MLQTLWASAKFNLFCFFLLILSALISGLIITIIAAMDYMILAIMMFFGRENSLLCLALRTSSDAGLVIVFIFTVYYTALSSVKDMKKEFEKLN
ncbi:hypothetical protein MsAc7_16260 [Methanolapillus millepedarum]|uniref:Uncharacterized protein n=2 Tax=Methanolapillus millepedarum TaxID=3028296 RepID=A0AA96V3V3_9EURY|nr:hypothetical protein MsAc7_16260 [Methanosarcinaceae archaeon Ac7]